MLKIFCSLDIAITHWSVTKKKFSSNGWEMAEILTVTNKAGYRSSYLELKIFCSLDIAILPTGGLPKKISAQLVEKWLRYWQWPTKLAIEAPSWSLKFFVVLTLLLPTGGLPKKISAQLVEKWLRYWQLKVCVVGWVGWVPVHCLVTATVRFGCDNISHNSLWLRHIKVLHKSDMDLLNSEEEYPLTFSCHICDKKFVKEHILRYYVTYKHMSHFVKSSKSELMFAALALPRGWKNQVEHWNLLLSHFGLSSRSEWIDNCLQLLDVSEKYHWLLRTQSGWKRDKCQDCYQNVNFE